MIQWLERALKAAQNNISEDVEGYLLGRGVREEAIKRHGLGVWSRIPEEMPSDYLGELFRTKFDPSGSTYPHGEYLTGMLVRPVRNGKGALLGFQGRSLEEKKFIKFFIPRSKWNPIFIGLNKDSFLKIWGGANVWLVEGGFDVTALENVVPDKDVVLGTCSAHLSYHQAAFLSRFMKNYARVNIAFDMDEPGRKAILGWKDKTGREHQGALKMLRGVNVNCQAVSYRGGKDPCEIWETGGTSNLRSAFSRVL